MRNNPIAAYENAEKATLSGKELEAHVLDRAAQQMAELREHWGDDVHEGRLTEVLLHNQKVWSFFQAEISQPDNPLPPEIKQNLLTLSVFIDKRIFEIMAFPEAGKLDILIEINRNLAAGLRGELSGGDAPAAP